jgi:diadenosine tetraphosphate (Ap4A) HIT family hydrolase
MSDLARLDCPFCHLEPARVLEGNDLALAFSDAFPVAPGHTLAIPRRHVPDFFDLSSAELTAVFELLSRMHLRLRSDQETNGFNIGVNIGAAAGQSIMHAHVHLIPRRPGDVSKPLGGVRNVIPGKGPYPLEGEMGSELAMGISKSHVEAVTNFLSWQHKAELHFHRFIDTVQVMPLNERFWQHLDHFREMVKTNLDRGDSEPVAAAAREFFRLALIAKPPLKADQYLLAEALEWFRGYKALRSQLDQALADLYEFHGDSYGDLIDAIPLGGRALCERALGTTPSSHEGFLCESDVSEAISALPAPWSKLVTNELYVASILEEHAQQYLVAWIRENALTHEQSERIRSCGLD